MRERKIVRDGAGYGVQERDGYDDYVFLNEEPFPSARSAREWLRHYDAGKSTDWNALRIKWARGFVEVANDA